MTTFQRARSEEQREQRRQVILDTAGAMLTEMSVADVSLNELSRRVGLAKSNVLRYFESREAVLLELLDLQRNDWLDDLEEQVAAGVERRAARAVRCEQLAAVLAASLAERPILCDLLSSQAAVLERNVSPVLAATYKRSAIANATRLGAIALAAVAELGETAAQRFAAGALMVTGAIWSHAQPSTAMLAAYEAEPDLAAMRLDVKDALQEVFAVLLFGLLARH